MPAFLHWIERVAHRRGRAGSARRDAAITSAVITSAGLLAATIAMAYPLLDAIFAHREPGGWDGVCHFAVGARWAEASAPRFFAWMPEQFAGMPFPTFYPPLFFAAAALLARLGLEYEVAFWSVELAACLAVPLLVASIARRLTGREIPAMVAGAIAVGYLLDRSTVSDFGVSLHATFNVGLIAQTVSFVCFLVFVRTLLDAPRSRRAEVVCALALAAVPLSNVHVVWDALFFFVPLAASQIVGRARPIAAAHLRVYLRIGSCAVLVSACWVLPMLARLAYVPTKVLDVPDPAAVVHGFLRVSLYGVLAVVAAIRARDRAVLGIAGGLLSLLLFGAVPLGRWLHLEGLAIQPARFLAAFLYMGAVLIATLVDRIGTLTTWPRARLFAGLAVTALFLAYVHPAREATGHPSRVSSRALERLAARMRGARRGRFVAEQGAGALGFVAQCLPTRWGAYGVSGVHRESSLNAFFTPALRNSISLRHETFGTDSAIDPHALYGSHPERIEPRLELFGVRWLLLEEPESIARVRGAVRVREVAREGAWTLLEREGEVSYALVPTRSPALVFAPFTASERAPNAYDFVRLSEEMFVTARLDVPLARARATTIEGSPELDDDRFGAVLLTEYPTRDAGAALSRLTRFARRGGAVIALEPAADGDRTVFDGLERAGLDAIRLVRREPDRHAVAPTLARLFDALEASSRSLHDAPRVTSATLDETTATIELSRSPSRPTPVWIRQGYFPDWIAPDGEPVYLATPSFQLFFATERRSVIRLRTPPVVYVGWALSALGALGLVQMARRRVG
ncbi:MAG: hypothetical protein AB7S26_01090 [Sandaracinaceae bacterium]